MIFNLWDLVIEVSDVNKIECLLYPIYHFQHLVFTRFTGFTKSFFKLSKKTLQFIMYWHLGHWKISECFYIPHLINSN